MKEAGWYWSTLPSSFHLDFSKFPSSRAKNFIILVDLWGGEHGHAWLAASTHGVGCVIKFSQMKDDNVGLTCCDERSLWSMPCNSSLLTPSFACFCTQAGWFHLCAAISVPCAPLKISTRTSWAQYSLTWLSQRNLGLKLLWLPLTTGK